jgi:hypothetical protein
VSSKVTPVNQPLDLICCLLVLRERFFQVLSAIITQLGLNVLKEEKWIPLIVADEYEYKQLIADNKLDTLDPAGSSEMYVDN